MLFDQCSPFSRRWARRLIVCALMMMVVASPVDAANRTQSAGANDDGVALVRGFVNQPLLALGSPDVVAILTDLTAFVNRDFTAELPAASQVMAPISYRSGELSFGLPLPLRPQGTMNTLVDDHDALGVQIYSVNLHINFLGGPFLDPFEYTGWPVGLSSLALAPGSFDITGGNLIIWAPDDEQRFPTGFGPDGDLFSGDEPLGTLDAGWTIINLESEPFERIRASETKVEILPGFAAPRDYSRLGYVAAFDALVDDLATGYPFTSHKDIDWETLRLAYRPMVEHAARQNSASLYGDALHLFALAIGDGHLSTAPSQSWVQERYGGGVGLILGQTDAGEVIVTTVDDGSPAADSGLAVGDTLLRWNDQPTHVALANVKLLEPVSSPHAERRQRLALLPRMKADSTASVIVRPVGMKTERRVDLTALRDDIGLLNILGASADQLRDTAALPVTFEVLPSGEGYIRVRSLIADPLLVSRSWDYAIDHLTMIGVTRLIVDVRGNAGGYIATSMYLAGSFVRHSVTVADLKIATIDGAFVTAGGLTIRPARSYWDGDVAVIIDDQCLSACEMFVGAVSANPATRVIGHTPTAGVVATVFFWVMPGFVLFQAPLGRYDTGDGAIWLEGSGISPTEHVPVTRATLLAEHDVLLLQATRQERGPVGASPQTGGHRQ